jgi:hypothetical protein
MKVSTFVFIEQGCKNSRMYSSIYNEKTTFYIQNKSLRSLISEELNRTFEGCNPLWRAESFKTLCTKNILEICPLKEKYTDIKEMDDSHVSQIS